MDITEFPPEILTLILSYNDSLEYYMIRATCKYFRQLVKKYFRRDSDKMMLYGSCSISVVCYLQEHHYKTNRLLRTIMFKCSLDEWKNNYHSSFSESQDINKLYVAAASTGNLPIIKYLMTIERSKPNVISDYACRYGHLDCLKYAQELGLGISSGGLISCIINGRTDCVKYIFNIFPNPTNKFKLPDGIIGKAISKGYKDCAELMLNNGYIVKVADLKEVAKRGRIQELKYLMTEFKGDNIPTEIISVMTGNLESLKYLKELNLSWNQDIVKSVVKGGNIKCLRYCVECGFELTPDMLNLTTKPSIRKYINSVLGL